jgi:hypothetical protein
VVAVTDERDGPGRADRPMRAPRAAWRQ